MAVRVPCINKRDRTSPHERISHIGGTNSDRKHWKFSEARAIKAIESGEYSFYVSARRPVRQRGSRSSLTTTLKLRAMRRHG